MSVTLPQTSDRMVLKNISWQTYQDLVHDLEQELRVRLTYDRGLLEIQMPLDKTIHNSQFTIKEGSTTPPCGRKKEIIPFFMPLG